MAGATQRGVDATVAAMTDRVGGLIWGTDISESDKMDSVQLTSLINDVKSGEITSIVTLVVEVKVSVSDRILFSIFDYVGFDPEMVPKVLRAYQKFYKTSDDDLLSDIRFSLAAVLYMGNLQTKSMTRRALEGRTKIEYLVRKYNIRTGTTNAGLPAEVLTFPRIAAAFPVLAVRMANVLPPTAVSILFKGRLVPACMRLTPFASLCASGMGEKLQSFLLRVCNAHASDMALAYERGRCKKAKVDFKPQPKVVAEDQWAFMEVAAASTVPSDAQRKELLQELNLAQYYVNLKEVYTNYMAVTQDLDAEKVETMSQQQFETELSSFVSA